MSIPYVTFAKRQIMTINYGATNQDDINDLIDVSDIGEITGDNEWRDATVPAFCWYNNTDNTTWRNTRGKIWNARAVLAIKTRFEAANKGWRVPVDADWDAIIADMIAKGLNWDSTTEGNKLGKAVATDAGVWSSSGTAGHVGNNQATNNASEMNVYPGGYRESTTGDFLAEANITNFYGTTTLESNNSYAVRNIREDFFKVSESVHNRYIRLIRDVYTVQFNSNGGSAVSSVDIGSHDLLTAPTAPTKGEYTFNGWYKDAGFVNEWDFDTDKVTADTTLYAKWWSGGSADVEVVEGGRKQGLIYTQVKVGVGI